MGEVLAVDFIISKTSFLVKYKLRRIPRTFTLLS